MKNFRAVVIFTLLLIQTSCASYGNKINPDYIATIKKGETTESELIKNIGNPSSIGILPDGQKLLVYTYVYSEAKASTFIPIIGLFAGGANTSTQTLHIWLNDSGTVSNYAFTKNNNELNTGLLAN